MRILKFIKGLFKPKYKHSTSGRTERILKIEGELYLLVGEYTDDAKIIKL